MEEKENLATIMGHCYALWYIKPGSKTVKKGRTGWFPLLWRERAGVKVQTNREQRTRV